MNANKMHSALHYKLSAFDIIKIEKIRLDNGC